ncbi:MAG TPA: hypothetical protein VGG48_04660 [Rhizomicrobium sp.]|jgi:hypothetical protein
MASKRKKRVRSDPARERMLAISDAMEMPLVRAAYLVEALEYVGFGMHSHEEDGTDAVFGIAMSLSDNLKTVQALWVKLRAAG